MEEPDSTRQLVILAMTTYSLLFCLNTAYGRLCAGLPLALSSRYVIYVEPAMLGLYFQLLNVRQQTLRRSLLLGFLFAVGLASFRADRAEMERFSNIKQTWKTCYRQTEDIQQCDKAANFPIHGPTPIEPGHLQEKLEYLKSTHQIFIRTRGNRGHSMPDAQVYVFGLRNVAHLGEPFNKASQ